MSNSMIGPMVNMEAEAGTHLIIVLQVMIGTPPVLGFALAQWLILFKLRIKTSKLEQPKLMESAVEEEVIVT